jgi:hypothetical protein
MTKKELTYREKAQRACGIYAPKRWTKKEIVFIAKNKDKKTALEMALLLKRSYDSVAYMSKQIMF